VFYGILGLLFSFIYAIKKKKKKKNHFSIDMMKTVDILCFEGSKLTLMIEVVWPLQVVLVVLDSGICLHP
jgi:hypothetical protein